MVRACDRNSVDFCMNTSSVIKKMEPWYEVVVSKTLLLFHGVILVTLIFVTILEILGGNNG